MGLGILRSRWKWHDSWKGRIKQQQDMTTIYYLLGIIFLWEELLWLMMPIDKTRDAHKFHILRNLNKGKRFEDYCQEYKSLISSKWYQLLIILWLIGGLFTSQWIGFLIILIFNFLIIAPLSNLTKFSIVYTILHWFNSLVGFLFGVFIIVNHYHLKINLTELVLSWVR